MAVVIESVSTGNYVTVTDVGTTGERVATNPSGLTAGDTMILIAAYTNFGESVNTPSGWSSYSIGATTLADLVCFYKQAEASDVSAGSVTLTTTNDAGKVAYTFYRLTGCRTDGVPILANDSDTVANGSGTLSGNVSLTPPNGTAIILLSHSDFTGVNNFPDFSAQAISGVTVTLTERLEGKDTSSDQGLNVADGVTSSAGTVTGFSYETSNTDTGTFTTNVLAIYPQQNASTSVSLTSNTNTAFALAGSAGANATLALTSNTTTAFSPVGVGVSPTRWTNVNKS